MKLSLPWIPFVFVAVLIGLYPFSYYIVDMRHSGLLSQKPKAIVDNISWNVAFYLHITFGGLALLVGWSQFSDHLRNRYLKTHRLVGKIYVFAAMLSSIAGLFVAFFATGGIISSCGFGILAILWFMSVFRAYTTVLKRNIADHENWMIRNYALTFAAVTLRLWLPLSLILKLDFILAYRVISWLCWVPNIWIAELIVARRKRLSLA